MASMEPDISSHGPRRATINEASSAGARLPAIASFSGHAPEDRGLSHGSALLEYLSGSAENATPVAAYTVGWPMTSVYTHTPLFPSLLALEQEHYYGLFPLIADTFFEVFDEVTPWLSLDGGRLRCLVDIMLAEQVMYFERRRNRYGSSFLPVSKLVGVVAEKLRINRSEADSVLCRWGTLVHTKFVRDNQRSLVDHICVLQTCLSHVSERPDRGALPQLVKQRTLQTLSPTCAWPAPLCPRECQVGPPESGGVGETGIPQHQLLASALPPV